MAVTVAHRTNSPTGSTQMQDSVPGELKRQAGRITDQINGLKIILEDSGSNLEELAKIFDQVAGQGHELPATIRQLESSLNDFNTKVGQVYGQMGTKLTEYATRMENSFAELQASVDQIKSQIDALNPTSN